MKHLAPLLSLLLLTHCATLPPDPAAPGANATPAPDDIARFLAGRSVRSAESLASIQRSDPVYREIASETDKLWREYSSRRRAHQSGFQSQHIKPLIGRSPTVIYPFGGPDVLHVTSMFPSADTYVLIGLEKVGTVPTPEELGDDLVERVSKVIAEPLHAGYFIPAEMRRAPAATPIILTSLGLIGARVESVTSISAGGEPAAEFRFRSRFGREHRLIYVSTDLSNGGFGGKFRDWLGGYSRSTAYFKAASYLMHDPAFSNIRDWVLGNCRSVVQDDSGIPFQSFSESRWNVRLLGSYERPAPLFTRWQQDDLAAAYASLPGAPTRIPFGSGYHYKEEEANLQVWWRK